MERGLTAKGALIELVIVTAGVLIALSADTVREWRNNGALADAARASIRNELTQNRRQIETVIAGFQESRGHLFQARALAQHKIEGKPSSGSSLNLNSRLALLSRAAYETAGITGAFAHMDPLDVQRFAAVYQMQRQFDEAQDRMVFEMGMVTASADRALDETPRVDPAAAGAWIERVEAAMAGLNLRYQMASMLKPAYDQVLK